MNCCQGHSHWLHFLLKSREMHLPGLVWSDPLHLTLMKTCPCAHLQAHGSHTCSHSSLLCSSPLRGGSAGCSRAGPRGGTPISCKLLSSLLTSQNISEVFSEMQVHGAVGSSLLWLTLSFHLTADVLLGAIICVVINKGVFSDAAAWFTQIPKD